MKTTKKIIFSILFVLTITISTIVFAENPDIYLEDTVSSLEEVEDIKRKHLNVIEKEYSPNLEQCTYIDYKTTTDEIVDRLNEITKESSREKDAYVEAKEEEGYTLTVLAKEHEKTTNVYKLNTLNGVIVSATKNSTNMPSYVGKKVADVVGSFTEVNNEDVRITYTQLATSSATTGTNTTKTEKEAQDLVKELKKQGYEASYTQNNSEKTTTVITSKKALTKNEITSDLQSKNTSKEVKDVEITSSTTPSTYISRKYSNKDDATIKYNELVSQNTYESVTINTLIDEENASKVSEKNAFNWTHSNTAPYTEDVYTESVKTGYKYYYAVNEVLEQAQNITETGLTERGCEEYKSIYKPIDGWTTSCTKVTTVTKSETVSNVIKFNETKQEERTWAHLDISVNQNIKVIDKDGNTIASNITGSLSNISVVLNEGTNNEKTISYRSPSYDNGRLEVRQDTGKAGYTKVTNEDKVKISATLSYTYNNKNVNKNIVLEGYLDNIFNVCKERNKIGGGFDLEFDVLVDREGNVYIVISTSETYTFTASKPAKTKLQGYYDEYEYQKEYQVVAEDTDYTYNVSYILTDYTVDYSGNKGNYEINEDIYDKYYVINGSKTTYKVTTIGNIIEDDECGIGGDEAFGKLIVNYITTDGKVLQKQLSYTEVENTPYETIQKSFNGYKFVKVEGNTKGNYIADETIVVTYIYEKLPEVNTGVIENNPYQTVLLVSLLSLGVLLVLKKKIFE